MGQRHQIYFIFPMSYKINMPEDCYEEKAVKHYIVGIHHQWLYGQIAAKQLMYFLKYCKSIHVDEYDYHPFGSKGRHDDIPDVVCCLYSTNPEGYYHRVCIEPKEIVDDPNAAHNNDGITLIDLRDINDIKYCFMYLVDQEDDNAEIAIEAYQPLSAKEYVEHNYPQGYLDRLFNYNYEGDEDTFKEENAYIIEEISKMATLMDKREVLKSFPTLHYNPEHEIDHGEDY